MFHCEIVSAPYKSISFFIEIFQSAEDILKLPRQKG